MANPKIQLRHDTAANWTSVNPVLLEGEVGIETDTKKQKIGDGSTSWNSLAYQIQDFISNIPVGLNLSIDSGILSAQAGHITSQTDILKTSSVISTADISTIPNGVTNGVILGETLQYQDVDLTSGVTYIYADADGTSLNTMTENSKGAWLIASSSQGTNSSSWAHYGLVFNTPLQAGQYKFSVSTGASYGFLYACSGEIGNFTIISTIVNNENNPQDVEVNIGSPIDALVWVVGNYNGWSAPYGLEVQKYESAKVFKTYLCKDNNSYSLKLATDTSALSSFDDYAQIGQVEYDNTLLNPVATPTEDLKNTFVNAQLANKDLSNLSSTGNAKFQSPLVSGTNIKTINSTSLLGSGDISAVQPSDITDVVRQETTDETLYCWATNESAVAQYTNTATPVFGDYFYNEKYIKENFYVNGVGENYSYITTDTGYTLYRYPNRDIVKSYSTLTDNNSNALNIVQADGQWVGSYSQISTAKATGTYDIDLSSYLPNDNYNYEVYFFAHMYSSNSTYSKVYVKTSILSTAGETSGIRVGYVGANSRQGVTNTILPIGADRILTIEITGRTLDGSDTGFCLAGYRRLGTNS